MHVKSCKIEYRYIDAKVWNHIPAAVAKSLMCSENDEINQIIRL